MLKCLYECLASTVKVWEWYNLSKWRYKELHLFEITDHNTGSA